MELGGRAGTGTEIGDLGPGFLFLFLPFENYGKVRPD